MQIASWYVNSIRARTDHAVRWLQKTNVDVLLLQELKGSEFPAAGFEELGHRASMSNDECAPGDPCSASTARGLCHPAILSELPIPRYPSNGTDYRSEHNFYVRYRT
jgi:endonuclease/exonuclease/phosphatase family metal-dependent hydrolase